MSSSPADLSLFRRKVYRLFVLSFLIPMARAFLVPTMTTSLLPLVIEQEDPEKVLGIILELVKEGISGRFGFDPLDAVILVSLKWNLARLICPVTCF